MISTFKVQNYRSFKTEQTLSFEPTRGAENDSYCCVEVKEDIKLLKTALIYGANASGKTNLLKAIEMLCTLIKFAPKDKNEPIEVEPFLLDSVSRDQPTFFYMSFFLNGEKYIYELSVDKKRIYKEELTFYPSSQPARLYYRVYNEEKDSSEIEFGAQSELSVRDRLILIASTVNNSTVLAAFGKSNVATSRLNKVYHFFSKEIKDILHPIIDLSQYTINELKDHPEIKDFLIKQLIASDPNICNIEVESREMPIPAELQDFIAHDISIPENTKTEILKRGVYTNHKLLYTHRTETGFHLLPQESESRGTLRYSGLAVILYNLQCKDSIFMIDEAETSLHYELFAYLIQQFLIRGQKHSQLIISTHDINLLDEPFIRRDTVWFAEKNINGETSISRLSDKGLHKKISAYNAYKKGKLGGKPNIQNEI